MILPKETNFNDEAFVMLRLHSIERTVGKYEKKQFIDPGLQIV